MYLLHVPDVEKARKVSTHGFDCYIEGPLPFAVIVKVKEESTYSGSCSVTVRVPKYHFEGEVLDGVGSCGGPIPITDNRADSGRVK